MDSHHWWEHLRMAMKRLWGYCYLLVPKLIYRMRWVVPAQPKDMWWLVLWCENCKLNYSTRTCVDHWVHTTGAVHLYGFILIKRRGSMDCNVIDYNVIYNAVELRDLWYDSLFVRMPLHPSKNVVDTTGGVNLDVLVVLCIAMLMMYGNHYWCVGERVLRGPYALAVPLHFPIFRWMV
jgi:hypothetical protein